MGYDTYYDGEFVLSRPLTDDEAIALSNLTYTATDWRGEEYDGGPVLDDFWVLGKMQWEFDDDARPRITDCTNDRIEAAEDSRRGEPIEPLAVIVDWLKARGVEANGVVYWDGEESDDFGVIMVRGNEVRTGAARVVYPEWEAMTVDGGINA